MGACIGAFMIVRVCVNLKKERKSDGQGGGKDSKIICNKEKGRGKTIGESRPSDK